MFSFLNIGFQAPKTEENRLNFRFHTIIDGTASNKYIHNI